MKKVLKVIGEILASELVREIIIVILKGGKRFPRR